jgi:hypothetical protein
MRRLSVAVVAAAVVLAALPATAHPTDLVRITGWAAALEKRGLGPTEAEQIDVLWAEFVSAVPAHTACLLAHPPRVEANYDMPVRAAYAPATATLYVKPPDLARLVVFHELAHHLDFTCGAADQIGLELRRAQGLPDSKPWWRHGPPASWPAEYFANAVAIALGETSRHAVTDATVALVEEWLGRRPVPLTVLPDFILTFVEADPGPVPVLD